MRSLLVRAIALLALAGCGEDCSGTGGGTCCKVCTDSKPCGDSCIPRNQTCSKGGGCACSGFAEETVDAP